MAKRIDPQQARRDVATGNALLVCAYEDDERFQKCRLIGALAMDDLRAREETLPKDREIVFYCSCPQEATSARRVEEYEAKGFTNVWALRGGLQGWHQASLRAAI